MSGSHTGIPAAFPRSFVPSGSDVNTGLAAVDSKPASDPGDTNDASDASDDRDDPSGDGSDEDAAGDSDNGNADAVVIGATVAGTTGA